MTDHQGLKVPTVGGVLLFGRDRQRHFPDAWIQAGRFRVTLFSERVSAPALDETDQAIVKALAGGKGLLTSEIANAIHLTSRSTRTRLARLVEPRLATFLG